MSTSPHNVRKIERFLHGKLTPGEHLLFKARMLIDRELREDVKFQRRTYFLVKLYHRKKLKEEITRLSEELFYQPRYKNFQHRINKIFN